MDATQPSTVLPLHLWCTIFRGADMATASNLRIVNRRTVTSFDALVTTAVTRVCACTPGAISGFPPYAVALTAAPLKSSVVTADEAAASSLQGSTFASRIDGRRRVLTLS